MIRLIGKGAVRRFGLGNQLRNRETLECLNGTRKLSSKAGRVYFG